MTTFYRYLVVSGVAASLALSATNAEANHEEHVYVMLVGHGVLLPGYASVLYYGANSEIRMPGGWLASNVITSAIGTGVGIYGFAAADHPDYSKIYGTNYAAYVAGVTVIGGAACVVTASIYQYNRPDTPEGAKKTAQNPVFLLPSMSVTRERGTTFELTAVGRF